MAKADEAVEKVLKAEPHLTHAEAIQLVMMKRNRTRTEKAHEAKKQKARERTAKGKKPRRKGSLRTISGGAVSPR